MPNNSTNERSSQPSPPAPKGEKKTGKPGTPENSIEQISLTETKPTAQQRHERIAVVAFRLAESRGFAPGGELEDWLRAETEIDG